MMNAKYFRFMLVIFLMMFVWVTVGEAREAPLFTLSKLDGGEYTLESLRGRPVVLVFFAVKCVYCRQELVLLEKLYQEYRDKALLEILAINMGDSQESVEQFIQQLGVSFPVLLDTDFTVASAYNVMHVPTVFFLDPLGNLADGFIGAQKEAVVRGKLDRVLWFRGLREVEVKNLVAITSRVVVLDVRHGTTNPFPQEERVVYKAVSDLERELPNLNPQDVHLLLVSSNEEGLNLGIKMAQAGFTRVYYQMVDVSS